MPYMMGGQMGMGPGSGPSNMRLPGPPRNAGMQQIPPSGPMMRAQVRTLLNSHYLLAIIARLFHIVTRLIAITTRLFQFRCNINRPSQCHNDLTQPLS